MSRSPLPHRRRISTVGGRCGNVKFFVTVGFYEDGTPGECFFDVAKAGTQMRAVGHAMAMMVSIALQHGASISTILDTLSDFSPDDFPTAFAVAMREAIEVGPGEVSVSGAPHTPETVEFSEAESVRVIEIEDDEEWTNPTYTPHED